MFRSTFTLLVAGLAGFAFVPVAFSQGVPSKPTVARAAQAQVPAGARGFRLRADGLVEGRISTVESASLELAPVNNAIVSFMQNQRVIAQGRTNVDGQFAVRGLTGGAVYSVFVSSPTSIAVFAAPVKSEAAANANPPEPAADKAARRSTPTDIRLVANARQNGDADYLEVQAVPRADFVAALQAGVLANGNGNGGAAAGGDASGGAAAGGSTGGGGGGGGGLGGGGLAAAAIAAGFAAGALGDDDDDIASPFNF